MNRASLFRIQSNAAIFKDLRSVFLFTLLTFFCIHDKAHSQQITWQAIKGPWEQMQGPYGGAVWAIVIASDGTLFIGTNNGVYRSTDGGDSWREINVGLTRLSVGSLVITRQGSILAATDGYLFRSQDNGDTWNEVYRKYATRNALALGLYDRIYLAATGGVYYSPDDGITWNRTALTEPIVISIVAQTVDSVEVVCAGTVKRGIFRTTDGGESWQSAGLAGIQIPSLAVSNDGLLAAGTEYGVYLSSDNGQSWYRTPMPKSYIYVYALTFGANKEILAGDSGGIYRSINNGQTWTEHDFVQSTIQSLAINAENHIFAGTATSGIYRSKDLAKNWDAINRGLANTTINGFALTPDGMFYAASRGGGIFRSFDNGSTWEAYGKGIGSPFVNSLTVNNTGSVFAGVEVLGVYRLDPGARTWVNTNNPRGVLAKALITGPDGGLYFGADQRVYCSKNNGISWTQMGNGDLEGIYALTISADGSVFAGTNNGVYHLANANATWKATALSGVMVEVLLADNQTIYAGPDDTGLYRSTDSGDSWSLVALERASVSSLFLGPSGYLFAGTNSKGVYVSPDGLTWNEHNSGLYIGRPILSLGFDGGTYLFAGTNGRGIYRSTESLNKIFTTVESTDEMSFQFTLDQNYPNPFNPSTTITFTLPEDSNVKLVVYDLLGREVKVLVNEWRSSGRHQFPFSFDSLPSGLYIYRLKAGNKQLSQRMVIMK